MFLDELAVLLLLLLVGTDILVNGNWKRYKYFFNVVGIMAVYAVYSLVFRNYNTSKAVMLDFILQLKPFVPFFVSYAIAPRFTPKMKQYVKVLCIATFVILCILACFPVYRAEEIIGHIAFLGTISVNNFLLYMFCSIDDDGKISKKNLAIGVLLLSVGLFGMRSKFFGVAVIAIYLFFLYKPGFIRKIKIKQIVMVIVAIILVFVVSWKKIAYYYITGNGDRFDEETIQSFARPVLYITMGEILMDYPVFGSGLASYATHASTPYVNYSAVYAEYGIDQVWGLSKAKPNFISDAFFAEFAQFGFVGIFLFLYFWWWIWQRLRVDLHSNNVNRFRIGVLIIVFMLIESTSGTLFIQGGGVLALMLLGVITGKYKNLSNKEIKEINKGDYNQVTLYN